MTTPTDLQAPQPAPTGEGVPVWPALFPAIAAQWPELLPHAQARHEFGLAKYGTPLRTANGRDALVDALQEALDLVAYLGQAEIEYTGEADLGGWAWQAAELAAGIARAIDARDKCKP